MFENDQQHHHQQQQQYILQESITANSSTMVLASSPNSSSPMNTNNNEHNINVVIRVRPIITPPRTLNKSIIHQTNNGEVVDQRYGRQQQQQHADETDADQSTAITFPAAGQIQVQDNIANVSRSFSFNVVFEPEATQEEVFEHSGVKRLIDMALDGFACTVFAYGQTSTGKTYTLTGNAFQLARENLSSASSSTTASIATSSNLRNKNWKNSKKHNGSQSIEQPPLSSSSSHQQDNNNNNNDKPLMKNIGIVQLSFAYLFEQIKRRKNRDKTLYVITVSYLEVYNEQVLDLLNPSPRSLNVRWAKDRGFYAENLFKVECEDLGDLEGVLEEGCKNRQVRSHSMNENSSRSHSVMTITLHSETADPEDPQGFIHKEGRLCLVDLAGSEKTKRTNSKGGTFVEANNINRSLLVLGNCIACLADPKRRNGHIPYRDSTLTKLLADSLSGNGMTLMIACVSPAKCDAQETISTLRYASRAKRVRMNPVVQMDPRELLILSLKREVRLLKMENYYLKQNYHLQQQDNLNTNEMNLKSINGKTNDNAESNGVGIDQMNILDKVMKENEVLRVENVQVNLQRNRLIRDHELVCRENEQLLRKLNMLLYKMNPNLQSSNSTTTTTAAGIYNNNNNGGGGLFSSASSPSILSLAYDDDIRGRVSQISQDQQQQQPSNKVQHSMDSTLTNNRNLFTDVDNNNRHHHHQSIDDNNDLIIIRNNNQNQKVSSGTKSNQTNNSNRSSQVTTNSNQNGIYSEQDNVNRLDLVVRGKSAVQNKSSSSSRITSKRNH